MSLIKSQKEIDLVRESCKIVSDVLKHIKAYVAEGVTTGELDKIIEEFIISKGGRPAFKGYKVKKRFFLQAAVSRLMTKLFMAFRETGN